MSTASTAATSILSALVGSGGMAALLRVRSSNRTDNANAVVAIQQATKVAIENVDTAAESAIRRARADAVYAQSQVEAAHKEVRELQAELMDVRRQLSELRGQAAADREGWQQETARQIAAWMQERAEMKDTIRAQQQEIQRLLLDQLGSARVTSPLPQD